MLHLLAYLEERGVDLERSEFDVEWAPVEEAYDLVVLLTAGHKAYLDLLHPAGRSEAELADHFTARGSTSRRAAWRVRTGFACCTTRSIVSASTRCCCLPSATSPLPAGRMRLLP
ncbi:hypothetical protein E1211_05120 [Micromonospora sp. 15K316]|uniref:hypothetical protein n=1 Tax=Micromonospora sp. 15K316 TaxID=2530376 RepID=UPI00104352A7|nr:hypothetical protein [Micromonospora sp. 15K316]TDC39050.1 hypothetical protein E1211_05120 [Micromonospora sp. 15K316]